MKLLGCVVWWRRIAASLRFTTPDSLTVADLLAPARTSLKITILATRNWAVTVVPAASGFAGWKIERGTPEML
jgi:hypothetical protein